MFQTIFCTEKDCGNEHGVIYLLHHNAGALQLNEIMHRPLKEKNSSLGYMGHFHKKVIEMRRCHLPGWSTLVICCKPKHIKHTFLHYMLYYNIKNCCDLDIAYPLQNYNKIYREQTERTSVYVHTVN